MAVKFHDLPRIQIGVKCIGNLDSRGENRGFGLVGLILELCVTVMLNQLIIICSYAVGKNASLAVCGTLLFSFFFFFLRKNTSF